MFPACNKCSRQCLVCYFAKPVWTISLIRDRTNTDAPNSWMKFCKFGKQCSVRSEWLFFTIHIGGFMTITTVHANNQLQSCRYPVMCTWEELMNGISTVYHVGSTRVEHPLHSPSSRSVRWIISFVLNFGKWQRNRFTARFVDNPNKTLRQSLLIITANYIRSIVANGFIHPLCPD